MLFNKEHRKDNLNVKVTLPQLVKIIKILTEDHATGIITASSSTKNVKMIGDGVSTNGNDPYLKDCDWEAQLQAASKIEGTAADSRYNWNLSAEKAAADDSWTITSLRIDPFSNDTSTTYLKKRLEINNALLDKSLSLSNETQGLLFR